MKSYDPVNTTSFEGVVTEGVAEAFKVGFGAYWLEGLNGEQRFCAILPNKLNEPVAMSFNVGDPCRSPYWSWNGDLDKPSFKEPIQCPGCWIGELQEGKFRSIVEI